MSKPQNVLAIDIGTSSVRAAIVSEVGSILKKVQRTYGVISKPGEQQEQDPALIARETFTAIRQLTSDASDLVRNVKAISFSSQMYSIFAVDDADKPLCNMILWSDSRSEAQSEWIKANIDKVKIYNQTGCPIDPIFPLSKILWIKQNQTEVFEKASRFISIKEYILRQIVGEYIVDHSTAAASGMFDISKHCWSPDALAILGLDAACLSSPVPSRSIFKFANNNLREELKLPDQIMVIPGGGDGIMASIGSGACLEGQVNIDLGTSGAVRVITDQPIFDAKQRLWCYSVDDDQWVYGGILSTVGNGLQWVTQNWFAAERPEQELFAEIGKQIADRAPMVDGVIFLPYLYQERSPNWDDKAKATIFGLRMNDDAYSIVIAYLESIAFGLRSILEIIEEKVDVSKIVVSGGLSRTGEIAQMIADILGRQLIINEQTESSLMGAAVVGLEAAGITSQEEFFSRSAFGTKTITPNSERINIYEEKYRRFTVLNQAIRNLPF